MFTKKTRRRKGLVAANVGAVVAIGTLLLVAAPAQAATTTASNTLLIGSGSATTYNLMQGMDTLYNDSPGCNLIDISTVTQNLNFQCPTAADTTTPPTQSTNAADDPYPDFGQSPGYTENPANDVSTQEPPYGSSTGIKQLETQSQTSGCSSTVQTAPLDYARSSRAYNPTTTSSTGDCKGLNFVAYAVDGVSYFYYPEVNGHSTPAAAASNLSQQLLIDAWNGTLQCWNDPVVAAGQGTPSYTYGQASPACQPIILYTAQAGSGTLSTWTSFLNGENPATYLGTLDGTNFNGDCVQSTTGGCISSYTYHANEHVILENEDRELIANGDEANALYFFSYGKFQVECTKHLCGKVPGATGTTTEALGQINGVTATKTSILCGAGVKTTGCTTFFSPTRFIYNVYSNGSNPDIPQASVAALNYMSEVGFICKPNTTNGKMSGTPILDPNTGTSYRTEISNVITSQGFFTIPFKSNEASGVTHTATSLLAADQGNSAFDHEVSDVDSVGQTATKEAGYCLTFTTDNNSTN